MFAGCGGFYGEPGAVREGKGKKFFFEKKNQKTFGRLSRTERAVRVRTTLCCDAHWRGSL
jgi:hypothetical protein